MSPQTKYYSIKNGSNIFLSFGFGAKINLLKKGEGAGKNG
jgi:hypothetical protein